MAEVHQLPDPERVEQEAADWMARLHAEDVSASDRARFREWIDAHPSHRRTYQELAGTWQRFAHAGPLVRSVAAGHLLGNVHHAARRRSWALRAAAAFAVIAIAVAWAWIALVPLGERMETGIGQQAQVSLPDGSKVDLNTNSRMRIDYRSDARIIRLERGEAHFQVAHDPQRPFWVVAEGTWVRALGTAFDVYLAPRAVEVLVTEGRVQVATARRSHRRRPSDEALARMPHSMLAAGQKMEYDDEGAQIRAATSRELRRSEGWRAGSLVFEEETLGDVIEELGRYTELQLVIEDATLRSMRVGGTFKASEEGARTLLAMLEEGWGVEVRQEPAGRVRLSRERE